MLLRVHVMGTRNVGRIVLSRRHAALRVADLQRLRVPMKKVLPFVSLLDHHPRNRLDDPLRLRAQLAPRPTQAGLFD